MDDVEILRDSLKDINLVVDYICRDFEASSASLDSVPGLEGSSGLWTGSMLRTKSKSLALSSHQSIHRQHSTLGKRYWPPRSTC
jgi:hypothetical protein